MLTRPLLKRKSKKRIALGKCKNNQWQPGLEKLLTRAESSRDYGHSDNELEWVIPGAAD